MALKPKKNWNVFSVPVKVMQVFAVEEGSEHLLVACAIVPFGSVRCRT